MDACAPGAFESAADVVDTMVGVYGIAVIVDDRVGGEDDSVFGVDEMVEVGYAGVYIGVVDGVESVVGIGAMLVEGDEIVFARGTEEVGVVCKVVGVGD